MSTGWAAAALILGACGAGPASSESTAPTPTERDVLTFVGMCDASAAVALSTTRMLVADDEDNILRVYDPGGGAPVALVDMSPQLALELVGKKRPHYPETDIEAGTTIGDRALWLASHGRSSKAKLTPERLRLFATTLGDSPTVVGRVYTELLADLVADPRYAAFGLAAASELAPKAEGGFNLEGMTSAPDGRLLIGVRNPVPDGHAILATVTNPLAIFDGATPVFADPIRIDLGGRGVRALSHWRGRYLIAAGAPDERPMPPALYAWDGVGVARLLTTDLGTMNPEALFVREELDRVLVVSDDGAVVRDGVACKDRKVADEKTFRATWVTVGL